ncbi:hypothetical protein JHK87_037044 [Glycine soja]|nr:hypothetical protein JHK87_037044 [Glycine soja]
MQHPRFPMITTAFSDTIVAALDGSVPLDSLIPPACGMPRAPMGMKLLWEMAWCMVEREVWEEGRISGG